MSDAKQQQAPSMKTGREPFHTGQRFSDFTLLDYWQWAESDLMNNARRGIVAEYLVARAVGAANRPREEWVGVDVETADGIKIEVKCSAYVQAWQQEKLSAFTFDIAPRESSWSPATNQTIQYDPPRRLADVYVFCVLGDESGALPDPLDLADWRFYVVATAVLNRERPHGKSISMRPLEALIRRTQSDAVRYDDLAGAIRRAAGRAS